MTDADDEGLLEAVATAIATADEQNGAGCYEQRMTMGKHAVGALYDEARAAIEVMKQAQAKEIEELRRERDEAKEWSRLRAMDIVELGQLAGRTLEAEAALAEATERYAKLNEACNHEAQMVRNWVARTDKAEAALADALEVLAPFATFANRPGMHKLPDDMYLTNGSRFGCKQVTAKEFRAASAFLAKHGERSDG